METPQPPAEGPATDTTRDTLRELRERAQSSLEKQRERMRDIESHLTGTLQSVSDQLTGELDSTDGRVDEVRAQLEEERRAWEEKFAQSDADLKLRMEDLEGKLSELAERELEFEAKETELAEKEQSHSSQAEALDQQRVELAEQESQLHAEREELQRQRNELASERQQLEAERQQQGGHQDERIGELEQQLAERADELHHRNEELENVNQHRDNLQAELESLRSELEAEREARQQALEAHNDDSAHRVAELEAQLVADAEVHAEQQQELQHRLSEATDQVDELRQQLESNSDGGTDLQDAEAAWQEERNQLLSDNARLAETLEKVSYKLASAEANAEPIEEVQSKFDLALEDLRALRQQNAELEQELARRPEQNADESAELISLREERDELRAELEEWKNRPAPTPESSDQEVADLQRRFEMAVEDVRELRAEKEKLEEQLSRQKGSSTSAVSSDGEEKWEDLKRRLMLSLEEESGEVSEERREERASIEHTIRITDDVVASKDREILELRQQLEAAEAASESHELGVSPHQEAIDADEVIQQQREKLGQLEAEITEKLRQTELDLSVERAKIAREQTELAEWRIELESLRDALPRKTDAAGGGSGGKGRWFSKLGLGGDEG